MVGRQRVCVCVEVGGLHQHSDVTFQMHPYHSDDGEIDSAPFQVVEKKKKKQRFLKQKPVLSHPLKNWLLFLAILIKALYSFLFVFFWT